MYIHKLYNVIGSLAVPGSMGDFDNPDVYYNDLINRPNEKDWEDVAAFVDEIMVKLKDYPYYNL